MLAKFIPGNKPGQKNVSITKQNKILASWDLFPGRKKMLSKKKPGPFGPGFHLRNACAKLGGHSTSEYF
jgi:hypothetical protein